MSSHGGLLNPSAERDERSGIGTTIKQALQAAYEIRRRKTEQGRRRAILKWCSTMKEVLS